MRVFNCRFSAIVLVASLATFGCGGDATGPGPVDKPSILAIIGDSVLNGVGTSADASLTAQTKDVSDDLLVWTVDGSVVMSGSKSVRLSLGSGSHNVCVSAPSLDLPQKCKIIVVNLAKPEFHITPGDGTVEQTSLFTTEVFHSRGNVDHTKTVWSVDGVEILTGRIFEIIFLSGSRRVCGRNGALESCANRVYTRLGPDLTVYMARAKGSDVLGAGGSYCFESGTQNECHGIAADGTVRVRPSFLDQVRAESYLTVSAPGAKSSLIKLTLEDLYAPVGVVLSESSWNGVDLSLVKVFEASATSTGSRSFYGYAGQDVVNYALAAFVDGIEVPVVLAGAQFADTGSSVWGNEEYRDFTSADSALAKQALADLEKLERVRFRLSEQTAGLNSCNAVVIRIYASPTNTTSSGSPRVCGDIGVISGGSVKLASDYQGRAPRVIIHELGHVLGAGHTCGWKTVMFFGCSDTSVMSATLTAGDIAVLQRFIVVQHIQRERGAKYGIPSMHHFELGEVPNFTVNGK